MAVASPDHQPNCTHPFCYQQLDRSKPYLRLFKLLRVADDGMLVCSLRKAEMTENYVALSYVWGPEEPSHAIRISDVDTGHEGFLRVRANLYNFLIRAASLDPELSFWTDAICIDQQNISELNHQVGQMGAVYGNAEEVRVWLGEDPWTGAILSAVSKAVDGAICPIDDLFDDRCCPAEFKDHFEIRKRSGFFKNQYWSRTWIVQEVVLAKKIRVQSSDGFTPWSNLIGLIAPDADQQSTVMQKLVADWAATSSTTQRHPLDRILDVFGDTECKKTHDRLYAFRALIEGGNKLEVDYAESPSALFVRAVKVLNVDSDGLLPLLRALRMDVNSLYDQCGLESQDLQKTQRVLAENQHILVTKLPFPPCSVHELGPCGWSVNGTGKPCTICHATIRRICEMPECAHGWLTQVIQLLALNDQDPGIFSKIYLSHFKNWLCSTWPDEFAGVHDLSEAHCNRCYACDLKKKTHDRGNRRPATMEQVEASVKSDLEPIMASLGMRRKGPIMRMSHPSSTPTTDDKEDPIERAFSRLGPNTVIFGWR